MSNVGPRRLEECRMRRDRVDAAVDLTLSFLELCHNVIRCEMASLLAKQVPRALP